MFRFLAALVLLALAAPASVAAERIESFHSHIVVERSGELVVTETIRVRAEGRKIKRGIFRDIPLLGDPEPDDKLANGSMYLSGIIYFPIHRP